MLPESAPLALALTAAAAAAARALRAVDTSGESDGAQRLDDFLDVLAAARLQHEIDLGGLQRQIGEGALVVHFLDIGIGLGEAGGDRGERPGQVAQFDR